MENRDSPFFPIRLSQSTAGISKMFHWLQLTDITCSQYAQHWLRCGLLPSRFKQQKFHKVKQIDSGQPQCRLPPHQEVLLSSLQGHQGYLTKTRTLGPSEEKKVARSHTASQSKATTQTQVSQLQIHEGRD
uniref:Uncharacterized protein n=1 Tax=Rousettus aegyptiacus TaxID=9407 RepID=A0A7J8DI17_ROUAE|nr:hypothetical protein HJG63_008532 [Rousettus aegyptiacus]